MPSSGTNLLSDATLPTTTPTNGQIPIGNGTTYVPATITAGAGITVTNGAGSISIANTGGAVAATQLAKAWVCFDGSATSPITPRASYNVSSVTRNSTGNFTASFTVALADANYAAAGGAGSATAGSSTLWLDQGTRTTSAYQFATGSSSSGTNANYTFTSLMIFGN